jgi:hypothetical protein
MTSSRTIAIAALVAGVLLNSGGIAMAAEPVPTIPPLPLCYTVQVDSPTTGTHPSVTVCRP